MEIPENLGRVEERIAEAAARVGRKPSDVLLVAVTKNVDAERVSEAIRAGVRAIGENRVQEAEAKWPLLPSGPERHLVGRLQRNKAGKAVLLFDRIESIDDAPLAEAVSRRAEAIGKRIPVLVEVNVSGEETKAGVGPEGVRGLLERIAPLAGIAPDGLMTIGPLTEDAERIRSAFRRMRLLFEELGARPPGGLPMRHLSMGMSGDFEIAVEEGATIVRVGSAIFGPRG
ncbi:MAG: YggS family pyridoxal phosphate-dependent enzyme [Candidatus Latescibacterota bacterium]|nr:MAG: YggS family pyridoxal phosphate-dependent enzyme [Candidatus Latescibacterota bacterium]